jgi:hypothetical protein
LGTVLFEARLGVSNARVSPTGDSVAFFDEFENALKLVDRRGQARTLASVPTEEGRSSNLHPAWTPSGDEVWFTTEGASSIWATSTRTGRTRLVYRGIFAMDLQDISNEGRVLVNAMETRLEVVFAPPGKQPQFRLSFEDAEVQGLSDDGRQVLLGSESGIYLRPTSGGVPLKLGPGWPMALSPDAKWVLATSADTKNAVTLLPVGPAAPRTFSVAGLETFGAAFFHASGQLVLKGRPPDDKYVHLYTLPLDGGSPVAMSDAGVFEWYSPSVSRDDRFVAAWDLDEMLTLYPTDGGSPVPLTEMGKYAEAVAWTPEGHLWVRPGILQDVPNRILLYDVTDRRVLEQRPFSLNDATGILAVTRARGTPDAASIVFCYERVLGHLFLLDGLEAAGH